jgi:tetratricopeptide (TPR) repeat protein
MTEQDSQKIQPVEFDASQSPVVATVAPETGSHKPSPWVWLGLGALAIVALAVIFVLPTVVSEYELPLERRIETTATPPLPAGSTPQSQANRVSPFTEAQRALQRKEAQDVLAELLAAQAGLDILEVEEWAQTEYDEALAVAQLGDEVYLQQDFIGARDRYQESYEGLQQLLQRVPVVLSQYLVDGEAALLANDSALAAEKFSVAIKLDPDSERAQVGLDRSNNLDEVNAMLAEGSALQEAGDLEAAIERFAAALDLDANSSEASSLLDAANRQLLENRFAGIMSEGFSLLQNEQPELAIEAFERAATLGINRDQADAAIQQTRDAVARVEIDRLGDEAGAAQNAEQWQQAVDAFQQVLQIDSNLLFAQQGLDYSGKRLRLDQLLEGSIANPERFSDDEVYQQTLDIFFTGRGIENPGPRLVSQLDRLQVLLENSQVPVTVNFVSDNATRVTLVRIADLGQFAATSLDLKPGRYVAVGIRDGYRDVRQEFLVGFGQTPEAVVVRCEEEVVTRGR